MIRQSFWVEGNPEASVVLHERTYNKSARQTKIEVNPSKFTNFSELNCLLRALIPNLQDDQLYVDRLDFTVDFLTEQIDWHELKRITYKPRSTKVDIYESGFTIGMTPSRLSSYQKIVDGLEITRIELQLDERCGISSLKEFSKLELTEPFLTAGIEFLEIKTTSPVAASIDELLKTLGL